MGKETGRGGVGFAGCGDVEWPAGKEIADGLEDLEGAGDFGCPGRLGWLDSVMGLDHADHPVGGLGVGKLVGGRGWDAEPPSSFSIDACGRGDGLKGERRAEDWAKGRDDVLCGTCVEAGGEEHDCLGGRVLGRRALW